MTLLRKIYLGFGLAVVLIVVVSSVSVFGIKQINDGYRQDLSLAVAMSRAADDFQFAAVSLSSKVRGLLLFPDQRAVYLQRVNTAIDELKKASAVLSQVEAGVSSAAVNSLVTEANTLLSADAKIRDAVVAGDTKAALADAGGAVQEVISLVDAATKLSDDASASVAVAEQQMSDQTNRIVLMIVLLALLAIAVAVAAAVFLSKTVTTALRSVILKLTSSASELSAVSAQVSASSVQTGASIVETTTTVREVKQSALVATERAAEIKQATDETARIAELGTRSVDETIAGIENMGEQMAVVTESIVRLSDQTSAISDVIATVKDLAEQSNLLSVNAAIEAARAGEQGKGFTVVAQEVKNLADQSKQAVSQVRDILADIQRATTSAVLATELGSKAIERGAVQSRESGSSIEQLAENVVEAGTMMRQTAVASEQQLAGMDQISSAMEAISEASNQNISGSRQVEDEVHHVLDVARDLERLIDNKTSMAAR